MTSNNTLTDIEQANARVELKRLINEAREKVWPLGCSGNFANVTVPALRDLLVAEIAEVAEFDPELAVAYLNDIDIVLSRQRRALAAP